MIKQPNQTSTGKRLLKLSAHLIAICSLIISFVFAESTAKPTTVATTATPSHTAQVAANNAAYELKLINNANNLALQKTDEDIALTDIQKVDEDDEDYNPFSDEALDKIDSSLEAWNPKMAVNNHPRLKNKGRDKLQITFFLNKISNIDTNNNKFSARFYVGFILPIARTYVNTRVQTLANNKQKELKT